MASGLFGGSGRYSYLTGTILHVNSSYLFEAYEGFRCRGTPMIISPVQRASQTLVRWVLLVSLVYRCFEILEIVLDEFADGSQVSNDPQASSNTWAFVRSLPLEDARLSSAAILLFTVIIPAILLVVVYLGYLLAAKTSRLVQIILGSITVAISYLIFSEWITSVLASGWLFLGMCEGVALIIFVGGDAIVGLSLKHVFHQLSSLPPMIAKAFPVLMVFGAIFFR